MASRRRTHDGCDLVDFDWYRRGCDYQSHRAVARKEAVIDDLWNIAKLSGLMAVGCVLVIGVAYLIVKALLAMED
jgi:hypothetical protein